MPAPFAARRVRRRARLVVALGLASTLNALGAASVSAGAAWLTFAGERSAHAQARQASTQKLIDQGKAKFDEQLYDESAQKLWAALLHSDITPEQKIEVYRWLAYDYILLKHEDLARSAVYALYAIDEDYELPKKESPRFREPFAKYRTQWLEEGKPGKPKPTEKPKATVTFKHSPAASVPHDQSLKVQGTFDDADRRVARISLYYRSGSTGKFEEVAASTEVGGFRATIPASAIKPPIVEYYVAAFDAGGLPIASRGDAETPLRVVVEAEKDGSIFETWWFWTGAGAVVAGGVITGVLLSRRTQAPGPSGPPQSSVSITIGQ